MKISVAQVGSQEHKVQGQTKAYVGSCPTHITRCDSLSGVSDLFRIRLNKFTFGAYRKQNIALRHRKMIGSTSYHIFVIETWSYRLILGPAMKGGYLGANPNGTTILFRCSLKYKTPPLAGGYLGVTPNAGATVVYLLFEGK